MKCCDSLDVGVSSHTKEQKTNDKWDMRDKEILGNDRELCRFGSLFSACGIDRTKPPFSPTTRIDVAVATQTCVL